ncbi:hypothetical protein [Aquitalea pelogenes]|uniref:hypothetical protein n=1 Tax=Aquitalea pelogenes TaxID=1293573 RepID=UPI0035B2DB81
MKMTVVGSGYLGLVNTAWLAGIGNPPQAPVILAGCNMYDPAWLRELGFDYQAIGR